MTTRLTLIASAMVAATWTLSACSTLATQPAAAVTVAGAWQQDTASSDDFEAKLRPLIETQRRRMMPRHGGMSGAGTRRGAIDHIAADELDPLQMPPEETDKVRLRLSEDLAPPARLYITVNADAVDIVRDTEPSRHFRPGETVSRIDTSGAATLSSGWDQKVFVIRARYTNHAGRSWRYEVEPGGGVLRVTFEATDAEFGQLRLQTRYHSLPSPPRGETPSATSH